MLFICTCYLNGFEINVCLMFDWHQEKVKLMLRIPGKMHGIAFRKAYTSSIISKARTKMEQWNTLHSPAMHAEQLFYMPSDSNILHCNNNFVLFSFSYNAILVAWMRPQTFSQIENKNRM